jgi:hypothetical protein
MVAENRGGKAKKPRLTQGQLERAIKAPDAAKHFKAHDREEIRRRLKRERRNLERDVPSKPWFEAKWHHGEQFPPGGDLTLMERCRHCDRYTPPNCLSARGVCVDCQYAGMSRMQLDALPSSNSGIDLRRLKASRRKHGPEYKGGL